MVPMTHTRNGPMTRDTTSPAYLDRSAPIGSRVADLLDRMTVDEKLAQLGSLWSFDLMGGDDLDPALTGRLLRHGIGHITRVSGASSLGATDAARVTNDIQRHLVEETRLGIPAIVHEEICSGLMAREATVFAQAIGVASTFRPEHNRAMADQIRRQMRAVGAHHGLSPVLDVCRDARWGRLEETYGEDPFLVSAMGVEFIRGLQGNSLADGVVATAKHFVGYGASEGGMNWAPAHIPERELRDVYLRPFEAAVREASLQSLMNGYHELDGVPCGANEWLMTDLLRGEWGFDGTVVSDYFAVDQLDVYHHLVEGKAAAAVTALSAGIDVELPRTNCFGGPLRSAIDDGELAIDVVDRAVERVLRAKFALGLFEQPTVDVSGAAAVTRTSHQIAIADRVAADSLVLVKNDGVLPLAAPARVALIGPNGDDARNLFGDYSYPAHYESLKELLRSGTDVLGDPVPASAQVDETDALADVPTVLAEVVGRLPDSEVLHVRGCDVNSNDRSGFDDAVAAAAKADVAVMVMGERSGLTDDCTTGESRDVSSLDLPGVQEELVRAVAATGTPLVIVLVSGRPVGSPAVHDAASAVLMAWLPGERGAPAIADALVGRRSPGGKLPVSFPRSSGQVPVFYAHKVSGGRSHWKGRYVDLSNEPLYPFGHGLSYSSFDIEPRADDAVAAVGDVVEIRVAVTNTGTVRADEVVQLYFRDPAASVTRPVRELCGFRRVTLDAGEMAEVVFELAVNTLGFAGRDHSYGVEAGLIELSAGSSSDDVVPAGTIVITGPEWAPVDRVFTTQTRLEPAGDTVGTDRPAG